ncbi:TonB-dependent receptor [Sphingobacterium sp. UT-1RO-CII-1]|uniref:TonB-dependent receptor n=1 Tax=Sphingobacterium sp. UT-1RO-CII-1 TaxID=2995225 RepID=UPI00227AA02E|nr:TonB-dependent receptor plug domain-containing protein [Sphingobacterium sp. UT-1RO-CII-1]MCY4778835.1 TonB-dependent receptor [Sphingobacterium sp. UT-1RO-CII-1]
MLPHSQRLCFTLLLCFVYSYSLYSATQQKHANYTVQKDTTKTDVVHLDSIAVQAKSRTFTNNSVHELSVLEMAESKGKLLAESLTQIAGISTLSTGSTVVKPVIHGLHSNRILILNQGIRQEGHQWGTEHAPEIDPFSADRLQVIKGAEGVRYGADALAGVVLISSDDIDNSRPIYGVADLIGMSNGRGYAVNTKLSGGIAAIPSLGWSAQVSHKKSGNYKTADYYLGNTGARELNFSGKLQYNLAGNRFTIYGSHFSTEMGVFEGAHAGTIEDIYARIAHGQPFDDYDFSYHIHSPKQKVSHDLLKASWQKQLSAVKKLELVYGLQHNHRREYDLRRVASDDVPMADMKLTSQSLDFTFKNKLSSYGAQALVQINNNTPGTGTTPIIPNYDSYSLGLFGLHHFHWNQTHIELGARYDIKQMDIAGYRYDRKQMDEDGTVVQYLLTDNRLYQSLSGTLGIRQPLSQTITWKSNLGLAWRAPSVNELYSDGLHHGSATYEIGNADLHSEKGLKWMNSISLGSEKTRINVDLYGQLIFNYIYARPDPSRVQQTIRGTFPVFVYEQHDALLYGTDIELSQQLPARLHYQGQLSLLRAKNIEQHTYLPYIPADQVQQSLLWQTTPSWGDSYLKITQRYVWKQTRYETGTDYAAPPGAYNLFDFSMGNNFKLKKERQLKVIVSVDNLFNTAYKDYMDRFRYFAHQRGRNIQLRTSYNF